MKIVTISFVCLILISLTVSANVTRWELSKENTNKKVNENSTIELECLDEPPINSTDLISWYRHGKLIRYQFKGRFYRASTSIVRITNVTEEDRGNYRCDRIINGFEHNVAVGFLDVLVPPKFIHLNISESKKVMNYVENDTAVLECCTNGNTNPEPDFEWFHYNNKINQTENFIGLNNQKCSRSVVKLNYKANKIPFECHVSNEVIKEPLKSYLQVKVEHKPVQVQIILNKQKRLNESKVWLFKNSNIELSCQALALPTVESYQWYFNGLIISRDRTLYFNKFNEDQIGNYSCAVLNKHGITFSDVKLIQMTYLHLSALNKSNKVNPILINTSENKTVELACKIDGNNINTTIIWSYNKHDKTESKQNHYLIQSTDNVSKIKINKVSLENTGYYSCSINTSLTDSEGTTKKIYQKRTFYLNFQYKPEISLIKSVYYTKFNESVKFVCEVMSNPKVNRISWYLNGKLLTLNKVPLDSNNMENLYSATSTYTTVIRSENDFGKYSCNATNTIGSSSKTIELIKPIIAMVPINLQVKNITANSAILTWTSISFAVPTNFILNINDSVNITISGQSMSFKMKELNSNETYEIKILEINDEGESNYSKAITFKTLTYKETPRSLPSFGIIELNVQKDEICFEESKFNSTTQFIKVLVTELNKIESQQQVEEYKIQPIYIEIGKYCVQHWQLENLSSNQLEKSNNLNNLNNLKVITLQVCYINSTEICSEKVKVQFQHLEGAQNSIIFYIILIILATIFSVSIIILFLIQRKKNNKVIKDLVNWDPKNDSIDFIDSSNNSVKSPVTLTKARYDRNPIYDSTSEYFNTKF